MTNKDFVQELKVKRNEYAEIEKSLIDLLERKDVWMDAKHIVKLWKMFHEEIGEYNKKIDFYSKQKPSATYSSRAYDEYLPF